MLSFMPYARRIGDMPNFFGELKHRHIYRIAAANTQVYYTRQDIAIPIGRHAGCIKKEQ